MTGGAGPGRPPGGRPRGVPPPMRRAWPPWSPPPRPANDRGRPPAFRPVPGARRAALLFLLILVLLLAAGLRL